MSRHLATFLRLSSENQLKGVAKICLGKSQNEMVMLLDGEACFTGRPPTYPCHAGLKAEQLTLAILLVSLRRIDTL